MKKPKYFNEEIKTIKKVKITKRSKAYKCHARTYNVEILKSFRPELQIKDTESAIKNKSYNFVN